MSRWLPEGRHVWVTRETLRSRADSTPSAFRRDVVRSTEQRFWHRKPSLVVSAGVAHARVLRTRRFAGRRQAMTDAIERWKLSGYFVQADRIDVHRSAGGWATTILHECSVDDLSRLAEELGATHATPVFFCAAAQLLDRRWSSVWIVAAEPDWISYGLWSNDRWEHLCQRRSEDDSPDSIIAFLNQETESEGVDENGSRLVRIWSGHHAPGTVSKGQWQLEYQRPSISIEPA